MTDTVLSEECWRVFSTGSRAEIGGLGFIHELVSPHCVTLGKTGHLSVPVICPLVYRGVALLPRPS